MRNAGWGITAVRGIEVAVAHAGIKKTRDVAVIFSARPAAAAAVYTRNRVQAPFIAINRSKLAGAKGRAQAVLIVSGVANALTGKQGAEDVHELTRAVAKELCVGEGLVLTATTGKIGERLPVARIKAALRGIGKQLGSTPGASSEAARAIMTTDTREKQLAMRCGTFTIGAMAKGSGMIHPDMATMLCFIATDARIGATQLQGMLRKAVGKSFNMLSVDGDTSTNDMVLMMATGEAGPASPSEFQEALDLLCVEMARKIAADGEGATKLIEATVENARSPQDAKRAALAIVKSPLVKAAVHGEDPNVGRILCAVGYSGARVNPGSISAYIGGVRVVNRGSMAGLAARAAKKELEKRKVRIRVDLNMGRHAATAYGCDLSSEYVRINSLYRT